MARDPKLPTTADDLPATPEHSHLLVRTLGAGGYWGRGPDTRAAIKAATYIQPGTRVVVCRCDEAAYCDGVRGDVMTRSRGPIYFGRVTSGRRIAITAKERD